MRASILGAALLGAVVISCGPPPQPPTGRLVWSFACDTNVMGQLDCGGAPDPLIEGITRQMPTPALNVGCFVDVTGANANFRVSIEQTRSNGERFGITRICGSTTTSGGNVANSLVTASLGAATISNVAPGTGTGPSCEVRVTEITSSSIKGQFRCARVRDNSLNARRINGVSAPTTPATADPEWAEFQFSNCYAGAGVCR
jgi:hypothetical protein